MSPPIYLTEAMTDNLLAALEPLDREQRAELWFTYVDDAAVYVWASNAIEGNTLTLTETTSIVRTGLAVGDKTINEHLEVVNGDAAYLRMIELARSGAALTEDTIKMLHRMVVGADWGGRYKDQQNYIRGAMHVPTSPRKTPAAMSLAVEKYSQSMRSRSAHPVAAAATLHWNITHIHPFIDGNGRTARLVSDLALVLNGYAPIAIDIQDKVAYFNALERSSMGGKPGVGNPEPIIAFFAHVESRALDRDRERSGNS